MTAPARLALLLPWLNGEKGHDATRAVAAFLKSFDGSASAAFIKVVPRPERFANPNDYMPAITDLQGTLVGLLARGFPPEPGQRRQTWMLEFPSLEFSVEGAHRQPPNKVVALPDKHERKGMSKADYEAAKRAYLKSRGEHVKASRVYLSPGAYTVLVDGELVDVVPYLVLQLLTTSGMAAVSRCMAPAPDDWSRRCGKFLITAAKRGRPQLFCDNACRQRNHAEEVQKARK